MKLVFKKKHVLTVVEDDLIELLNELGIYGVADGLYIKKIREKSDVLVRDYQAKWLVSISAYDDQWIALLHIIRVKNLTVEAKK